MNTTDVPTGCHERSLLLQIAALQPIPAPGCAPGVDVELGVITQPGAGWRGLYARDGRASWQSCRDHLSRVAAGFTLTAVAVN